MVVFHKETRTGKAASGKKASRNSLWYVVE
jgi:hypothetical protein